MRRSAVTVCSSDPVCQVVTTPQCSPTYRQQCTQTQVQQCSTVTQQECRTVDEGYYQTKCTTTTVTSLPIAPSTSTTTVTQGQAIQGTGDNCQYKWEGKGDNMRWVAIPGTCTETSNGAQGRIFGLGGLGGGAGFGVNAGINAGLNLDFGVGLGAGVGGVSGGNAGGQFAGSSGGNVAGSTGGNGGISSGGVSAQTPSQNCRQEYVSNPRSSAPLWRIRSALRCRRPSVTQASRTSSPHA